MNQYNNVLSNELVYKIDNLLLDNYIQLFNNTRKKRLIKDVFQCFNNDPDPYYLS